MLGIIGAMDVEVDGLKNEMKYTHIKTIAGMNFCQGQIGGKDVVAVKCGVGKVNAAMCTQILADVFMADAVINTGVAGSLNDDIDICDIVVSNVAQEHDMDVTVLGYERGIIPDMEISIFEADDRLRELAKNSAKNAGLNVNIFEGKIVSGDRFIGTQQEKEILRKNLGGDCAEMEGAAIAHVAYLNNIPFLLIRSISDRADGKVKIDYRTFEKKAAENSVTLLNKMIEEY